MKTQYQRFCWRDIKEAGNLLNVKPFNEAEPVAPAMTVCDTRIPNF